MVGLVKGYIIKEQFLINSLIYLKWNSLMRKLLCHKWQILIYKFKNILKINYIYFITK